MHTSIIKKSKSLAASVLLLSGLLGNSVSAAGPAEAVNAPQTPQIPENLQKLINNSLQNGVLGTTNSLQSDGQAFVAEGINTKSSQSVNVILQLKGEPAAVGQYAAKMGYRALAAEATEQKVQAEQNRFLTQAADAGVQVKVNYRYDTVLNGMEITVKADQIPRLAKLNGVLSIHPNLTYHQLPDANLTALGVEEPSFDDVPLNQIGVDKAWAQGMNGESVKVGVIDTGIDYLHPDLKDAYVGGYDSVNQDDDPYEDRPNGSLPGTEHGTHVSGTIAGRGTNPTSEFVQMGVAPKVKLYAYKALGYQGNDNDEDGPTGSSAQIIDAVEHAVEDGMNVINMSLGNGGAKDPNTPDSIAVNNAVLAGVVTVVASGNDGASGPYYYTMGSPASAQMAITVAAATSQGIRYSGTVHGKVHDPVLIDPGTDGAITEEEPASPSATDVTYYQQFDENLKLMSWRIGEENFSERLGTEPLQAVYVGLGESEDYDNIDVYGKVAFISRGKISFEKKMLNAADRGAIAAVIFNGNSMDDGSGTGHQIPDLSERITNRDGPIGEAAFMRDNYKYIPTFDLSGYEGRAVARSLAEDPARVLSLSFDNDFELTVVDGDHLADFSSRGPNSDGNFGIKPDLAAPGVTILSSVPSYAKQEDGSIDPSVSYDKAYARMSGTSMATPHVAGLAVLLKQAHPDWSPTDIRAALANTAETLSNESGVNYDVYSQGAGRVDVSRALATPALLEALDRITLYDFSGVPSTIPSEASSLSFGTLEAGGEAVSKPLQLKNVSDEAVTYTAKIVMHPSVTSDPNHPTATPDVNHIQMTLGGLDVTDGIRITAEPNAVHKFELSALADSNAANGVYEGEVLLENGSEPALHLPFAIHVGESADNDNAIKDVKLSSMYVSPGQPINISATINAEDIQYLVVQIYDAEGYVGTVTQTYDFDAENQKVNNLKAGKYDFIDFDGSYTEGVLFATGENYNFQLQAGMYQLLIAGIHYTDDTAQVQERSDVAFVPFYVVEDGQNPGDGNPGNGTPGDNNPGSGGPGGGAGGGGGSSTPGTPAPSDEASSTIDAEVLAAVTGSGQTGTTVKSDSTLEGTRLSVTVTDNELQQALSQGTATSAIVIGAADKRSTEVKLSLTASQLQLLKQSGSQRSLVFVWNGTSQSLPVQMLGTLPPGAGLTLTVSTNPNRKTEFMTAYPEAAIHGEPISFAAASVINGIETPWIPAEGTVVKKAFRIDSASLSGAAGALYLEHGKVSPVPALITPSKDGSAIVSISRQGFAAFAAASRSVHFTDIAKSWASSQIQTLADRFILNGTSVSTYSPKKEVTRAEFASMLVRALGLSEHTAQNNPSFKDLTGKEWFAADLAAAYAAGLVTGSDGAFHPNDKISRQDLTVMLARAIKLLNLPTSGTPGPSYADAGQFSAYAKDSINTVTQAGLMNGVDQNGKMLFQPSEASTREAVAKVLYELLSKSNLFN